MDGEHRVDGYLDRVIFRRLSRPLTHLLRPTPLSPNAVTLLGIGMGTMGGLLLGAPDSRGVTLGIGCLVVSGVLDCVDGELARLRDAESILGHALDVVGDTVVHAAVFVGIVRSVVRAGTPPSRELLVLLALGILGSFAAITWSEAARARRRRAGGWENRVLDDLLSPLSTRDWHLVVVVFALVGRLDGLVAGAAVGAHVFWVVVVLLVARVLRRARTARA